MLAFTARTRTLKPIWQRLKLFVVVFLFIFIQGGCTPSAETKDLEAAEKAYQEGNYEQVLVLSQAILQKKSDALPAHQLKARATVALDHIQAALNDHTALEKNYPSIAPPVLQEIIVTIIKTSLQNENYFVRSAAIKALGEMGDIKLIPMMIPSLKDPATFVRFFTVESLGQLEGPDLLKLMMAAGQDPDGMVRVGAVKVLASLGKTYNGVNINNLLATFTADVDLTVRLLSLAAMSKNGDDTAFSPLLSEIEKLPPEALASGVAALGQSGNQKAIPLLNAYIASDDSALRMYAAEAMGVMASPAFYPQLEKALNDKDPYVRGSAATSLGKLGDKKAILLIEQYLNDADPTVRVSAAEGLKRLGENHSDIYQAALSSQDYGVRHFTLSSLRRVWGMEALPLLESALTDEAPRVRTAAIRAIGEIGGPENLPRLKKMMEDPDLAVRTYAAGNTGRLINKIAGFPLKKLKGD